MLPTLERLTSPVAYLNGGSTFVDPFTGVKQYYGGNLNQEELISAVSNNVGAEPSARPDKIYRYVSRGPRNTTIWNQPGDTQKAVWYMLESCGPDAHYHRMGSSLNYDDSIVRRAILYRTIYDASNGTVSRGSIWRSGGGRGRGDYFKAMVDATY